METPRRQIDDFLLIGGRQFFRIIVIGRHFRGFGHVELRLGPGPEGQAVGPIEALQHRDHLRGHALALAIRQGHHLALMGEADQQVAVGVQAQDPGVAQIFGKDGDGKPRRQFQRGSRAALAA